MALHHMLRAVAGSAGPSDPYFYDVSLLLTGDGTNGAQNNTFLDSSTNNFTITRNGNTTQGSFSPYGSNWSNYFDGSGDYLTVPDNSAWTIDSDYTIEFWVNCLSFPGQYNNFVDQYSGASTYWGISWDTSLGWGFFWNNGSGETKVTRNQNSPLNTWVHVAIVKSGTTGYMFLNGTQAGATFTVGSLSDLASPLYIGSWHGVSDYMNGYISNLRIVKGTALYTSNFTPSTTPLTAVSGTSLLTCQSNRFKDNSSNNFAITVNGNTSVQRFSPFNPTAPYSTSVIGGSGYFDGTGDYLTTPSIALSTSDFTVESWVYRTATQATESLFFSTTNGGFAVGFESSGTVVQISRTGVAYIAQISTTVPLNQWFHIAVSKASNVYRVFINGTQIGTTYTDSTSLTSSAYSINSSSNSITGYISNLRLVTGSAVYTSTFTPPTAPLTAITNTSLLCNFTNAGIPDAAMMNDLETVGNAQVSTSVKKYGTGSLAFDGNGDYLTFPAGQNTAFGTGNFTIEGWFYATVTLPSYGATLYSQTTSGTNYLWCILGDNQVTPANKVSFVFATSGSGTVISSGSTTFSLNTWNHFAIVRNSGVVTVYLNGVGGTGTSCTQDFNNVTYIPTIGRYSHADSNLFTGYIDDLRITKGYARYTANFTPPTAALPTY